MTHGRKLLVSAALAAGLILTVAVEADAGRRSRTARTAVTRTTRVRIAKRLQEVPAPPRRCGNSKAACMLGPDVKVLK